MIPDNTNFEKLSSEQRIEICKNCPSYNSTIFVCKECGCFMPVKTKIPTAKCPLGKW